ncbi:N-acetylmuramoyl-L-alanine amidase [Prauserella flavalba]|uniref:N-acetylmuramoyl-L-alanine amidase n=1 Tax=Prauserella flavalba TaxID=1477506 RepID=UPI001FEB89AA|nr:N-acetylmuramoyl-L-alanine amidase [Prauserella flavalba]
MRCRGVVLLVVGLVLSACGDGGGTVASPRPSAGPETSQSRPPAPATTTRQAEAPVVVLDPGHNGGNATALAEINRQVPAGRGRMKPCNTTGTATDAGYPEHAFNLDVARRVGDVLAAQAVRVVYTRESDDGVGPCVDRRAAIGNEALADAVVSIHADGSSAQGSGFHVAYSDPPLNEAQGEPAQRLAGAMLASMAAEFPVADYIGEGGLSGRDDLAGLNLSERPAVLVECGNMRNAREAAAMSTPEGRQRYADAISAGILAYLRR